MMAQLKDLLVMGPGRIIGDAFFGGKLMPTITETQDIGSETVKWNNIYAKKFVGPLNGTADSANQIPTHTFWGQTFNGTQDVSGNLTNAGPNIQLPSSKNELKIYKSDGITYGGIYSGRVSTQFTTTTANQVNTFFSGYLNGKQHVVLQGVITNTTTNDGYAQLILGNGGSSGKAYGEIHLYDKAGHYAVIRNRSNDNGLNITAKCVTISTAESASEAIPATTNLTDYTVLQLNPIIQVGSNMATTNTGSFVFSTKNTANSEGFFTLILGNSYAKSTVYNATGRIQLYNSDTTFSTITAKYGVLTPIHDSDNQKYIEIDNYTVGQFIGPVWATNIIVSGNASVAGTLSVTGATTLASNLTVAGTSTFNNNITVTGEATFNGNVHLNSSTDADSLTTGSLIVTGNTSLVNDTSASNILPNVTNSKNLGSASLRWAKLYIGDADSYGSNTTAVYWNAGVPKAVDVSVTKAGAANYLAYYDAVGSIKGTSNIQVIDGCLNLYPSNSSYREGMRIHPSGSWSDITLMGNTNTSTSGIAATDWFIGNNSGTFYLTHAGSSSSTTGYMKATGTAANKGTFEFYNCVGINGTNNTYNLYVNGTSYFNNTLTATNFTHQTLTASGYTAAVATDGANYFPATWKLNLGRAPVDGDIVTMIVPNAGHGNGVFLSTQDGAEGSYKPIAVSGTSALTTHMPVGHIITLAYDADGSVNSIYPIAGAAKGATTSVTGGCWRVINYYDSGNTKPYGMRVYHQTSGTTYENDDYPLLVSHKRLSGFTGITAGSYSNDATYGLVYGDGTITPTIQPSTGIIKAPGGIRSGDIVPLADDTYYLGYDNGVVRRWKIEATSINGTSSYISGAATFEGMTLFNGTVSCYNNFIVGGSHVVTLNSPTTINSSLTTSGVATFNGNVALNSSTTADSLTAGSLLVTGNTSLVNTTTTSDILPSENNAKNIGSSSMKYANIYATTFNGALSGNVTGNVQGNVTGNVTGNLTGNVSGNVTGNVNGNVTGNLTGNVTGNVTGNLYGTADYATTVRAILSNTEKLYVLGTTTTLSSTGQNVSVKGDSGVYMTTTAGEISAVRHSWNTGGTEKAYSYWNTSTESIDFIFV